MWSIIKITYGAVFYKPLLNGLLFLTSILPFNDLGLAVILLTVSVRFVLFPFTHKTLKTQQVMKKLEPDIKRIQGGGKSREEQAKELMELYKAHGINPFSGFFSLFLQLPILIAVYRVFLKGIPFKNTEVYGFLTIPQTINTMFLGFISLTEPNIGMAAIAAISQFWQAKLAIVSSPSKISEENLGGQAKPDMSRIMQRQMLFIFPIMIFFISFKLPAAVSLYWTSMNIFAIVHEAYVRNKQRTT